MNTTSTSYQINKHLHLVAVTRSDAPKLAPPPATHHILCVDVSGSMSGDLPKLRAHLREKLPTLVGEGDRVSVIAFSGRGEVYEVVSCESVGNLRDLDALQKKLDRWLKPVGLTGFVEPFERVAKFCSRFFETCKSMATSLMFMSDGCDNQWDRAQIFKAFELALGVVDAVTIVEYGYYADRKLLGDLAARAGGSHIFAEDLKKFEVDIEAALLAKTHKMPRVSFSVKDDTIGGVVFAFGEDQLITARVEGGEALLPANVGTVYYLSPTPQHLGAFPSEQRATAMYAALSIFSMRGMPDVIEALLREVADVHYIKRFSGLFGKQAYSQFALDTQAAVFDRDERAIDGIDISFMPSEDAFTVLDLLAMLCDDKQARLLLDHPAFKYSKISRSRVDATDGPFEQLRFEVDKQPDGVPFLDLTWNEDRANVSMLVHRTGVVDLSGRMPFAGKVPLKFPTHVFRNYAVVADGLKNISKMPVSMSYSTYLELDSQHVKMSEVVVGRPNEPVQAVIDLDPMPVLSRKKVNDVRAFDLFSDCFSLQSARAAQKVFKYYRDQMFVEKVKGDDPFVTLYGREAAEWLAEQGLTSKGGYQPPKTAQAPVRDFYMGKVLEVSLSGLNSLPKVDDVIARMGKGKLTPAMELMAPFVEEAEKAKKLGTWKNWIDARANLAIAEARGRLRNVAIQKFAIIVSQKWFPEFSTIGEGSMEMSFGLSKQISAKVEMTEEKVFL